MSGFRDINAEQLKTMLAHKKVTIIDVRTPAEFNNGHISGALSRPLGDIENWSGEFSTDKTLVLVCASGARSTFAARQLGQKGFSNLYNLSGGMSRWTFQTAN